MLIRARIQAPLRHASIALAAALALTGCGGGGDNETPAPPGASTQGIWRGTLVLDGERVAGVIGMTDAQSDTNVILRSATDVQLRGRIASNGTAIDTSLGFLTLFNTTRDTSLDVFGFLGGIVNARGTLDATLQESAYGRVLLVGLAYDAIYERPSSLALVAGTWRDTSVRGREWRIDAAGAFSGSDGSGCVFQGNIRVIDPARNLYRVDYTVAQCYSGTIHVTGHAFLDDAQAQADVLRSAGTGGYYSGFDLFSFVSEMTRQ